MADCVFEGMKLIPSGHPKNDMGGGRPTKGQTLATCTHHPRGNRISLWRTAQTVKLTSKGALVFSKHSDRIGAIPMVDLTEIQELELKTNDKKRTTKEDGAVVSLAILGWLSLLASFIFSVFIEFFYAPLLAIVLLGAFNRITTGIEPPQRIEIYLKEGGDVSILNRAYWSTIYQQMALFPLIFYLLLGIAAAGKGIGVFVLDDQELTAWENLAMFPFSLCILGILYYPIAAAIHFRPGIKQDEFRNFCWVLIDQFELYRHLNKNAEQERNFKNWDHEIQQLKQRFDAYQVQLNSIKIEIETLYQNPAASIAIQQIGIATERMLKLACDAHDAKPGNPPSFINYVQWLNKNTDFPSTIFEAAMTIHPHRNHSIHHQHLHADLVLLSLMPLFIEIIDYITETYLGR